MTKVTKTPAEGNVFIATYGSLRTGMHNFHVNASGHGKSIGLGKTCNNYNLYSYFGGSFPSVSLVHDSNNAPVVVEVFEAPEKGLTGPYDRLEGYPSFYNRTQILVQMDDGEIVECWIYHIDEEQPISVPHGDWCLYKGTEE